MTTPRIWAGTLAICLAVIFPCAASAHSTVKRTNPASGSVLAASPARIEIEFNEVARLTSVVAVAADESERKLSFTPSGSALAFAVEAPGLAAGRHEIRWKALSKDGHPIAGTIILVIKPSAAPAPSTASGGRGR